MTSRLSRLDELRAIVDEVHRQHHKVASHAMALNGVHNSVEAGVDSIEHGNYIAEADLKTMAQKGIFCAYDLRWRIHCCVLAKPPVAKLLQRQFPEGDPCFTKTGRWPPP
jgi:imidazolonepropionase-like amidohydrolase